MKPKHLTTGKFCIIILFFTFISVNAAWSPLGPLHKNIHAVSVSPINSNLIFAAAFGSGIYKSTDGGATWVNDRTGLTNTYVRSILALSDTLVFCGTNEGVFKSTDGGNTWNLSQATLNSVRSLAYDSPSNALYAATYGTFLYKSTNLGTSWSQIKVMDNSTLDSLPHERAVSVFGKDSVYVGGSISDIDPTGGALFKSLDGGINWTQVQPGLAIRSSVMSIAPSANAPESSLIIGTAIKGVYKSTNGGVNWTQINGGGTLGPLPDTAISAVGFNPTLRYAATETTGGFYYRSLGDTNNGWFSGSGLPGPTAIINGFTIDILNRNKLFAGTEGKGVYASSDSGKTWSPANSGMLGVNGRSLARTPSGRLVLGTGFGDQIWYSLNGGTNWIKSAIQPNFNSIFSVNATRDSLILYATSYGTGVLKSTDAGNSWTVTDTVNINHFVRPLVVDSANLNLAYVGTGNGVYKTSNGFNWSAANGSGANIIPFSTSVRSLALDPTNANIVYAGTDHSYLYKTTDGGLNWNHVAAAQGFAISDSFIRVIAIDRANTNWVYAGSDSGHVYRSTDSGNTWSLLTNLGIPNSVREILINPTCDSIIFVGTFGSGIYVSLNQGTSWAQYNLGLTDLEADALISDKNQPLTLWVGTESSGVFKTTYSFVCGAVCTATPGDVNASGGIPNLQDVIYLVNFVFDKSRLSPPCNGTDPGNCWTFTPLCRGDVNGSGGTPNLQDVIYLVNFVFDKSRLSPPCNGTDPGNCWVPVPTSECCLPTQ